MVKLDECFRIAGGLVLQFRSSLRRIQANQVRRRTRPEVKAPRVLRDVGLVPVGAVIENTRTRSSGVICMIYQQKDGNVQQSYPVRYGSSLNLDQGRPIEAQLEGEDHISTECFSD